MHNHFVIILDLLLWFYAPIFWPQALWAPGVRGQTQSHAERKQNSCLKFSSGIHLSTGPLPFSAYSCTFAHLDTNTHRQADKGLGDGKPVFMFAVIVVFLSTYSYCWHYIYMSHNVCSQRGPTLHLSAPFSGEKKYRTTPENFPGNPNELNQFSWGIIYYFSGKIPVM